MYQIKKDQGLREPSIIEIAKLNFWRTSTFWVCLIGYIGYYLCRANLPAAFPLMSTTFGYTNTQLGLIAATSEGAYSLGKFINGPLADKFGGKKIFLLGLAGAIFFNVVFAFSSTLAAFILVWCICRYFLSMGWGGLTKMIGNWYPPEQNGTVMGFISINFQFGGVIATLFAGLLVSLGVGWQGIFLYPALLGLVVLIWAALSSKQHPADVIEGTSVISINGDKKPLLDFSDDHTASGKVSVKKIIFKLISLPLFRHLLVFSFISTLLRSFFFFWTPKLLVDTGMGASSAIFKSALFPFFGCVGTILLGWYSDKFIKNGDRARPMWIMLVGLTLCLIALAELLKANSAPHPTFIGVALSLAGFFLLGPYSMSSGALTLDIAGAKGAGTSTGLIDGLGYIGGALAAWVAGALSDKMGWSEVFYFLAISSAFATFSAYMMSRGFQKIAKGKS